MNVQHHHLYLVFGVLVRELILVIRQVNLFTLGGNKNHLKIIYKYFYYSFAKLHLQNYVECSVHVTPLDSFLLCINKVNFILHGCLEKGKGDNKILYSYMRIFMFSY